jgi:hypothetical protein
MRFVQTLLRKFAGISDDEQNILQMYRNNNSISPYIRIIMIGAQTPIAKPPKDLKSVQLKYESGLIENFTGEAGLLGE